MFFLFSPWYPIPLKALKQNWKKLIFIGFLFRAPFYKRFPLATVTGRPTKVFQPFGWRSKAYLPGPAHKGFTQVPFLYPKSHYKAPPFKNIFQFSRRWNLITSWFSSWLCIINKAFKLTSRANPRAEVRENSFAQFSRRRLRKNFCRSLACPTAFWDSIS